MKNLQSLLPEIKLKMPSISSLGSANKKYLLKPLQQSQQSSIDKTLQLKRYLTKNRKKTINLQKQQQLIKCIMKDMPSFAKSQWPQLHLFKYHIQMKRQNPLNDLKTYQSKLIEVQKEFTFSLQKYKYQLQEGQQSLHELSSKIYQLFDLLKHYRLLIKSTKIQTQMYHTKVLAKIHRLQNIQRTILMAKAWSKSNISKILSKNVQSMEQQDIGLVMQQMDKCCQQLLVQKQLQNIPKLQSIINVRKNLLIQKIQQKMLFSIINFSQQESYRNLLLQYQQLLKYLTHNNAQKSKQYHQLQKNNLEILIHDNVDQVFYSTLNKHANVNALQLLNQLVYVQLFQALNQEYKHYFHQWHRVTAYHLKHQTHYQQFFIKMVDDLALNISKKYFHQIKYSQKFFSLSFHLKLRFIMSINKLVDMLEEWTSKKDISLFQLLRQKFKIQIDNFRKQANGNIKFTFVQEFSEEGLLARYDQPQTYKSQTKYFFQIPYSSISQLNKLRILIANKMFDKEVSQNQQNSQVYTNLKQKVKQLNNLPVDLQVSKVFIKAAVQYCQRENILPFNHIQFIIEHFEFLILLVFKVCIFEGTKSKLIQDFAQKSDTKIKELQFLIDRNPFDEIIIPALAKSRQSFLCRRNYNQLYYFLADQVKTKFDNVILSGFLSINKLYHHPQDYIQLLNKYHSKVTKLIEQLLLIARWLIKNQHLFKMNDSSKRLLQSLPLILKQLLFLYFQHYNYLLYQKYVQRIQPLIKGLKWKIQKLTGDSTTQFKQYKLRILQIYRSSTLTIKIKDSQLHKQFTNKHLEVFYKALLFLYSKVDKINDNGRQLLRLDVLEIARILTEIGYKPGPWSLWFQKYLQICNQRSYKTVLDKIQHLGLIYPLYCWKSHLVWIINDLSNRQKKDYFTGMLKIYINDLKENSKF